MTHRLTIRDVAERAGVSVGTVSHALNRPGTVADDTLARVLAAVDELGFIPNSAARQLRGARSQAIGLVILHLDPFFTAVTQGIEDAAAEVDHLVILCSSRGMGASESRQLRLLEEQRVGGILLTPASSRPVRVEHEIRRRGTPVVLLDYRSARSDQCSVAVDDEVGGRLAAQHLLELGHERLALVSGSADQAQHADRRRGFIEELRAAGIEVRKSDDISTEDTTIAAGEFAVRKLIGRRDGPTAIFCTDDLMALGAEHALLADGKRIPEDIAIVGYDDVPFAAMAFVPLTTVRQPAYDLGYRSAKLLLQEASAEEHVHDQIVFVPELVVRESTAGEAAMSDTVAARSNERSIR